MIKTKVVKIKNDRDIKKWSRVDEVLYLAEMMDYEQDIQPNTFERCQGITNVICGDKTKIIGERAFANCKNLIRFDGMPQIVAKEAFTFCSSLKSFNFSTLSALSPAAFSYSGLESANIPAKIKNIPSECFAGCINLRNVNLNEVETIESDAFQMTGLKYIKIQNALEVIGKKSFEGCMTLADIFVERILPPKIYSSSFYGCPIHNVYFYSEIQYNLFLRDENWSKYQDYFKIISPKDAKSIMNELNSQRGLI